MSQSLVGCLQESRNEVVTTLLSAYVPEIRIPDVLLATTLMGKGVQNKSSLMEAYSEHASAEPSVMVRAHSSLCFSSGPSAAASIIT